MDKCCFSDKRPAKKPSEMNDDGWEDPVDTASVGSVGVETKKKNGIFKRLARRSKKSKLESRNSVGGDGEEPEKPKKKKIFFGFGGRSLSQPDLFKNKQTAGNNPGDYEPPSSPSVRRTGLKNLNLNKASPRSQSVPKPINARLTPVVETPSENEDKKNLLTNVSSLPPPSDNKPVFSSGPSEQEDDRASTKDSARPHAPLAQTRSMPGDESSTTSSETSTVMPLKDTKLIKRKPSEKADNVDGKASKSDLGETKKQGAPPVLVRGHSGARLQSWISSVSIFLFEGKDLPAMDRNGLSDPFCKFRLGNEKYRTRIAYKTLNPKWMEQFELFLYDINEQELELTVWDWDRGMRNDYIGKALLDLRTLESEKLHDLWLDITGEEGEPYGSVHLSVMVSGKKLMSESIPTEETAVNVSQHNEARPPSGVDRYHIRNALKDMRDVGTVTVKVFRGCALRAADLNGKSDPYCVLQLVNARLQTQVEPKTLDPEWNRVFTFPVHDVHSVLDISVYDMDQDKSSDFLGRIAIPLLKIHNNEKRWYALKDQKLMNRSKGSILLEMELVYNPIRAALRTVQPREVRYDDTETKFKRQVFVRNVTRIRTTFIPLLEIGLFIRSCLNWESKQRSIIAFIAYILTVYFFEIWMMPAALAAVFLKYYVRQQVLQSNYARETSKDDEYVMDNIDEPELDDDDDLEDAPKATATNTNIVAKVRVAQEQLRVVQNLMGYIADLCERVTNTFQFAVPWLSFLAIGALSAGAVLLYFIPVRVLLLVWGIHKFTKKLRKPNAVGNNELLDFLSRVPTHEEARQHRELRPREIATVSNTGKILRRDASKVKLNAN